MGAAVLGALGIATTLAVLPATAQSDSQGSAVTTTAVTSTTPAPTAVVATRPRPARSSLWVRSARHNVVIGHRVVVRGSLRPRTAGKAVKVQIRRGHRWVTIARTVTRAHGRFSVRYTPRSIGTYRVRVAFHGDRTARASRRSVGTVNVYRKVFVSWYGGGGAVACPGSSGQATYGVAHKTLPCGTMVTLRYRGRTVRAKVIDRGPYVGGREFDLTAATKTALGAGDLTTIESTR